MEARVPPFFEIDKSFTSKAAVALGPIEQTYGCDWSGWTNKHKVAENQCSDDGEVPECRNDMATRVFVRVEASFSQNGVFVKHLLLEVAWGGSTNSTFTFNG